MGTIETLLEMGIHEGIFIQRAGVEEKQVNRFALEKHTLKINEIVTTLSTIKQKVSKNLAVPFFTIKNPFSLRLLH